MSTSHAEFWRAIWDNPDDHARLLVYADWLDRQGDADRAELIRLDCQLRASDYPLCPQADQQTVARLTALAKRRETLQEQLARQWGDQLSLPAGVTAWHWQWGFLVGVWITDVRSFLAATPRWAELGSVASFCLAYVDLEDFRLLCQSPELAQARTLLVHFRFRGLSDHGARALADSPYVENLQELALPDGGLSGAGLSALARSETLRGLRRLNLHGNPLGPGGTAKLAEWSRLQELDLGDTGLGGMGVSALVHAPHVSQLRSLKLDNNGITNIGVRALAFSSMLENLHSLNLANNPLGKEGLKTLVDSPRARNLKRLDLSGCDLGTRAGRILAENRHLGQLLDLSVASTALTDTGLAALMRSHQFPALRRLNLGWIQTEALPRLVETNLANLRSVRFHIPGYTFGEGPVQGWPQQSGDCQEILHRLRERFPGPHQDLAELQLPHTRRSSGSPPSLALRPAETDDEIPF